MGIASKYNKVANRFLFNNEGFEYIKLSTLFEENGADKVYPIYKLFINRKGSFGDHPVVATETFNIDLPEHLTDTVNQMINDDEAVDAINAGKVGIKIYSYESKNFKRTCYSVNFVDI